MRTRKLSRQGNACFRVWVDGVRAHRLRSAGDCIRSIYATRDVVVKVASDAFNREQNCLESRRFRKYASTGLVPRVIRVDRHHRWVAYERIRGLQQGDYQKYPDAWTQIERLANEMRLNDVDCSRNWGVANGRPVLYDAGC